MSNGRLVATAFALALAASVAVPAAGANSSAKTHTLLTTKSPIRAFAQDTSRIAWVDGKLHVDARKLGPKAKTLLVGNARPEGVNDGVTPQIVLAGARVSWTRTGGGNDFETGVWARDIGAKAGPRLITNTSVDREQRNGSYFGALAAGSSTIAFAGTYYDCADPNDCTELATQPFPLAGVIRVVGTSRISQLPGAVPSALELAIAGGRVALLPAPTQIPVTQIGDVASPQLARPDTTVEIRNATTGDPVAQFTPPGTVRALALAGPVAAVVDELSDGTRNIERYDATTGALLGTTVGVAAGDTLAGSGHTFVFDVGRGKIESMDASTGADEVLAVSPTQPIGLSVAGKRVAWAVNAHGHGRVLALNLP